MMIKNNTMIRMVLRLFLAMALYIRGIWLELRARWFRDLGEIIHFKEGSALEAELAGKHVIREESDLSVELTHAAIEEAPRGLNLILGINQFGLQRLEIFTGT